MEQGGIAKVLLDDQDRGNFLVPDWLPEEKWLKNSDTSTITL